MNKNKPVHEVKMGAIKAAIWENNNGKSTRHSVTFTRLYRQDEVWKTTESFGRDDLLLLAKVADQSHTWIANQARAGA